MFKTGAYDLPSALKRVPMLTLALRSGVALMLTFTLPPGNQPGYSMVDMGISSACARTRAKRKEHLPGGGTVPAIHQLLLLLPCFPDKVWGGGMALHTIYQRAICTPVCTNCVANLLAGLIHTECGERERARAREMDAIN